MIREQRRTAYQPAREHFSLAVSGSSTTSCCWDGSMMPRLFEQLLMLRNDLGLLAEEYDPHAQRLVGNYPQAFSHIALINSAYNLARAAKPAEQRSGAKAQPAT